MREDWLLISPCVVLAFIEIKYIWRSLPEYFEKDTEISGGYSWMDDFKYFYFMYAAEAVFIIQWACNIFPIAGSLTQIYLRLLGYGLVTLGFLIALISLKKLGSNWSGMTDFRIKKNQVLVKDGIYALVRHPIYLAVQLEILGYELVVNSWLVVPVMLVVFWYIGRHVGKEHSLLEKKFGAEFRKYRSRVSRLLPWIY